MKKITLLAALLVAFTINAQLWEDGFENYDDFAVDTAGSWSFIDIDGDTAYGSAAYDFENENYIGSAIIFNPSAATPDASGDESWGTRTGDKGLYAFASNGDTSGTPLNNDYIITPALDLTGVPDGIFSFWAQSVTDAFGLERMEVLLSTTGTAVEDFTVDLGGDVIEVPTSFTEYSYDLTAYADQIVYIAIHYIGADSFVLQMDDFALTSVLSVGDNTIEGLNSYVSNDVLSITARTPLENVTIHNILGQVVISKELASTSGNVNLNSLTSGVYIATVQTEGKAQTIKFVK